MAEHRLGGAVQLKVLVPHGIQEEEGVNLKTKTQIQNRQIRREERPQGARPLPHHLMRAGGRSSQKLSSSTVALQTP